jgi:hypothetical protein
MPVWHDWSSLARETFRSLTREDLTSVYKREWPEARRQLVSEHREEIEAEGRRWKRWLRTTNAIVFGLVRRLTPARRVFFVVGLLAFLSGFWNLAAGNRPTGGFDLLFGFIIFLFLLAMELVDKIAFRDELALARELQADLVTRELPDHPSFALAAFNRTANMVGGDLYEFVALPDGRLALLFGDASGHGMAAGLVMAVAHAGFRTQLAIDPSPRAMVEVLNRILCATGGTRSFFSCVYALFRSDGRFAITVSGHPPPVQIEGTGRIIQRFGKGSYPLGIRLNLSWEPIEGSLSSGETLLLYSDGLYEACDDSDIQFGEERVERVVRLFAGASPTDLVRELSEQLAAFCGRRSPEDDVSIAAIRFEGLKEIIDRNRAEERPPEIRIKTD